MVLEIAVAGATSDEQAVAIARRIATSPLVKTAAFGHDPNWGRVLAAAGSAPWNGGFAELDPGTLSVSFDGVPVFAARCAHRRRAGARRPGLPHRARSRSRCRPRRVSRVRPVQRLRAHQRGVHDVSPHRPQARWSRRRRGGRPVARLAGRRTRRRRRSRRRPADHGRARDARHRACLRRRAPGDDARGAGCRAGVSSPVNADVCAAIGPVALGLFGDEIGLAGGAAAGRSVSSATRCRRHRRRCSRRSSGAGSPSSRRLRDPSLRARVSLDRST